MPEDFKVKVGEVEGPLELILELIEKRKLHISDISLSQIADEFVEHIKTFEEFPISDSADFILVASTLLLIKSKSLLPNLDLTSEEQGSIEDLENRLINYKKYKELAIGLQKIFGHSLHFACEKKERLVIFSPTPDITTSAIQEALQEVLRNMPQKEIELPKTVIRKVVSLEEVIGKLSERIQKSLRISFREFSGTGKTNGLASSPQVKVEIIVSFLAMLELVKRGAVRVKQDRHFDDISIETESTGVPTYT